MSCTQGAGVSLKWLRDNCCAEETAKAAKLNTDSYYLMDKLAESVPVGSGKLLFLPYLMGERSPHPDPDCRGVFFGLSASHTRANLIRAVLEGVAFSQRECLDVFRGMGVPVNDMTLTGGGGKSALWRQMLSDLYGCPVKVLESDEGAALGAALLAAVGTGVYKNLDEACSAAVKKKKAAVPSKERSAEYEPYFKLYKKLYRSLFDDFKALSTI
jgi:xylulokinase